ncbi:MAG: SDR family oxidoreductase [Alphaproteobacteria bacterium]|jgi:NAD(P)-dependent dehydrogenase (short-subunit alcohol dehydrogenase family)
MPTILITGAGRGLGLELARRFVDLGWETLGTVRDPAKGAAMPKGSQTFLCDSTDRSSLARLARDLAGKPIDVLFCNAGMFGKRKQSVGTVDYDTWAEVMRVNVFSPMACVEALVDNVAASARRQVVMMSSRMGSMGENAAGGEVVYRSSKAALNAVTKSLSIDLAPRGITVVAVHPGWVQTDMGGPAAALTPAESVAGLADVVLGLGPASNGGFLNHDGAPIAW